MPRTRTVVALLATILLIAPMLAAVLPTGAPALLAVTIVLVGFVAMALLLARRGARDADEGEGRAWEFVPRWQYDGRFAEAGGLTREEQERAIERVHEEASKRS